MNEVTNTNEVVTRDNMLNSRFAFKGKVVNDNYKKTPTWLKKNSLREINQKRLKCDRQVVKMKKGCLISKGLWKCPHCSKEVTRLTVAHVGMRVSEIIDNILEQYPDENDIHRLDKIVQDRHDDCDLVICCDKCNRILDDTK
jgi:ribosomal protein L37AE/L43A